MTKEEILYKFQRLKEAADDPEFGNYADVDETSVRLLLEYVNDDDIKNAYHDI